jgi:t-SNARE complex subunit (syntaxin)
MNLKVEEVSQYEKIEKLKKMENDLYEINEVYQNLNNVTEQQGEGIDIQFQKVSEANENIGNSVNDLEIVKF